MKLKENASSEKLRGGYYTPSKIAYFLTTWGMNSRKFLKILEPSCGDGAFIEAILQQNKSNYHCIGVEIIQEEANKARSLIKDNNKFEIINDDFYAYFESIKNQHKFNVILGNPPYIRYQYLSQQQRDEHALILKSNKMKSNKLINAWVSFIVACVELLDKDGRLGFVIPAELLQVKYAEELRYHLMKKLQKITIITFKQLIFPNVEQEVMLLMAEKDSMHDDEHKIRILEFNDVDDMINNYDDNSQFKDIEFNGSKWTRYFLSNKHNELINEVRDDERFLVFKDVADVDIGITTGNNKYFCVDKRIVEEYELEEATRPLIARSVSIHGLRFTNEDWRVNIDKGARAYLLDFPDEEMKLLPEGFQRYILHGEETGQNTGYKCSIRKRWYKIPSIWSPDAFFLRRNYLYPKFILNTNIKAVSTDTMHRIKFKKKDIQPERILLSYYNSIGLAFTEIEGRSYGGGVLEILPGELENVIFPNLMSSKLISDEEVYNMVERIDRVIRTQDSEDIIEVLNIVDNEILVGIIGLKKEMINEFRKIWLILRSRRLKRGNNKK